MRHAAIGTSKEALIAIIPNDPNPGPGPSPVPDLPPIDKPTPPIKEPEPDRLPDEDPNPNPDENDAPEKQVIRGRREKYPEQGPSLYPPQEA